MRPHTERKEERILSYWAVVRKRFFRNRMAVVGAIIIALSYLTILLAEFTAPYRADTPFRKFIYTPPQRPHFIDNEGKLSLRPFVYGFKMERDPETLARVYKKDVNKKFYLRFLVRGEEYEFLFLTTDIHLFGVKEGYMFLLGTDHRGRDLLSRIIYGGRISLTVGLVGVLISMVVGTIIGLTSGYLGGKTDNIIQRFIEVMLSFPRIPLWLALTAALPPHWSPLKVYFGITVILSIGGWGGLARIVRGMTLALKSEEYVLAGKMNGATTWWIISRHLLPGNLSYIIVAATLAIPGMILGETALSFLGLGVRAPMVSWGVLLQRAQNVTVLAKYPWIIIPVSMVIVSVLSFNFIGDGLRDAIHHSSER